MPPFSRLPIPSLTFTVWGSLVVGAMGGDVLATDSACILDSVLGRNILANSSVLSPSATVQARELDWTVPSTAWSWSNPHSITNPSGCHSRSSTDLLTPPFDIIFTADTVYSPHLVQPLLDTATARVQEILGALKARVSEEKKDAATNGATVNGNGTA